MLERFSLPDVTRVGRRTVIGALVVAVVALGLSLLLNYPLAGVGACVGLGLGILNFRMITSSVIKVGKRSDANKRRPLAMNTLTRLGAISVVTLGLLFLNFNLGFGVLAGLAIFQMLLLANVTRAMFVAGKAAGTEGPDDMSGAIDTTAHQRGDG